jgi:hypothetical protein
LLCLDRGFDSEVLGLLTHQDRNARHRENNAKDDCRGDPEQAFWLGNLDARRDGALDLRFRPGNQAGAVELGRDFRRFGRLHSFIAAARDNAWRPERVPVVRPARSDRLSWIERRNSRQALILRAPRADRRRRPAGPRRGGGLVGHGGSQLGSSRGSHRRRRCGWPPRGQGWRLRRGPGRLAPSLRRRRRSLRRALNGRGCGSGLPCRCRLRR